MEINFRNNIKEEAVFYPFVSSKEIYDKKVEDILLNTSDSIDEIASILPDFVYIKSTI